ncbi:MAG: hypothetical protein U1F10_15545 [Burkholderiales bacterium]
MIDIDVKFVDALRVDYVEGAEAGFDAATRAVWDALVVQFPFLTLNPLVNSVPVDALRDMLDAVRTQGLEPPNVLSLFEVPCPEAAVDAVVAALQALAFVEWAQARPGLALPGVVHYGGDPRVDESFQLDRTPNGVDAVYAWNVAGGSGRGIRFADIEYGWMLGHEDLADAHVVRASTPGPDDAVDHGTAVLGIVLATANGLGGVGIAPDAAGFVVSARRANGRDSVADALTQAGFAVGSGGVVLLEVATAFTPAGAPDIPVEFSRAVGQVIQLLAVFGVTVIEPAGNGAIDLDAFPFLAHLQRGRPGFVDTFAVMVGAANAASVQRANFSSHGARVDCFGAGTSVRTTSSAAPAGHAYEAGFSGTSSASAIVAGAAVALQGMALANTGNFLAAIDVRRLLSDPNLNVLSANSTAATPNADGIGVLPDLRAIARHMNWPRIVPPAVVAADAGTLHVMGLDDFDRPFSRQWQEATDAWSAALARGQFATPPEQVALLARHEPVLDRTMVHALVAGVDTEVRYFWWDTLGQAGPDWFKLSTNARLSRSEPVAAGFSREDRLELVAVNQDGRLVALRASVSAEVQDFGPPQEIDSALSFAGCAGPAMVESIAGALDVVAIDSVGRLRWSALNAGTGDDWDFLHPIGGVQTRLARTIRPALAARGTNLDVLVIGVDRLLYTASRPDPATLGWSDLRPIGGAVPLSVEGSIAVVSRGAQLLDAFVIDTEGFLRWTATNANPFADWSELTPIGGRAFQLSAIAGVTAVTRTPDTLDVFAVATDGSVLWLRGVAGSPWPEFVPI